MDPHFVTGLAGSLAQTVGALVQLVGLVAGLLAFGGQPLRTPFGLRRRALGLHPLHRHIGTHAGNGRHRSPASVRRASRRSLRCSASRFAAAFAAQQFAQNQKMIQQALGLLPTNRELITKIRDYGLSTV